ncbi:MAG: glycoside hydrolase family 2 protein, partial [Clostridia bacterium]|nr:glycoside hydrolase family 2 protein [Clostridia bacterium]
MKIDLCGSWNVKRWPEGQEFTGKVPGSAMNDLLQNNLTEDPFYRDNEYKAYELFRSDYEYYRTFVLDDETIKSDSINLVCEGLDTLTDIFINGKFLASTDNMHRTYGFDIRHWVDTGQNEIKIIFKSPIEFIEKSWAERG